MALTEQQQRAMEATMRIWREDAASHIDPKPGDVYEGCDGAGSWFWDDGLGGQILGCEDCAGTGRVRA